MAIFVQKNIFLEFLFVKAIILRLVHNSSNPGLLVKLLSSVQKEMQRFVAKIVYLMKGENLFASQGGPIILAQVISFYTIGIPLR